MTVPSVREDPLASPAAPRSPAPDATWPGLHDYGIIGNEVTGALISRFGSIDWACLPKFDSPSVFGRLLDRARGGYLQVTPVEPFVSHQQYVPGTNLLTTFFELRHGVSAVVTDFMPMGPSGSGIGGDPRIVRRLVAKGAPLQMKLVADARFDYGRGTPEWTITGEVAVAERGPDRLACIAPWPWTIEGTAVRAEGRVVPGTPVFLQARWGALPPPTPSAASLLAVTDAYWRGWTAPAEAPMRRVAARWHPWVERSELVLKLLSYAESGVFVAAPTTSLPEWIGGSRNWDYRYVWIRDAAFTAQVLLLLGHVTEARAYVAWAFDRAAEVPDGRELRTIYTVDGGPPPAEEELDHLEGYRGSRPVRVGNAAADQRQLDIYGELLDLASLVERVDPAFVRDRWSVIERLAEQTTRLWNLPDAGIWERRSEPQHYVHSKLMCWVAIDRAVRLAREIGRPEHVDRWQRVREEIRSAVLSHGYDEKLGSFTQAFDRPVIDASGLRISLEGFLPPEDPRVLGTIDAVERRLTRGAFVRRYEGDDGLQGPEG
ncbi:MAG TPA: glycoside hydrolase family 15 protein, partial [Thermoplasmata archaeon]|nr:glycoside hydrolase family 15 protein [Thermoplasmata archaeon]